MKACLIVLLGSLSLTIQAEQCDMVFLNEGIPCSIEMVTGNQKRVSFDLKNNEQLSVANKNGNLFFRNDVQNKTIFRRALYGIMWGLVAKFLLDRAFQSSFDQQTRDGFAFAFGILSALTYE